MQKKRKPGNMRLLIVLHIILMFYSLGGYFSKTAALSDFLSFRFIICYMLMIAILGVYAIAWQQIIKKIPLTTAYANKAITVVWGLVWGFIFFREAITVGKIIGVIFIVIGIILYVLADGMMELESVEELWTEGDQNGALGS